MKKNVSAAFFDIDHTLTRHSTAIRCIMANLIKFNVPIRFCLSIVGPYFKYKKGTMNLQNCDSMMKGMDGIAKKDLDAMASLSFEKFHEKDLYEEMIELIGEYKNAGIPVILATSSPRFVVEPYYRYLDADHLICTELAFDEKEVTSGKFDGKVAFDSGKKELVKDYMVKMGYEAADCAFYSDSIHDLPTLKMVGSPVAVNPDRELKARAGEWGWDILEYNK